MEIKKYIFPLRKWWWLVIASILVAVILGYQYYIRQPKIYQTHTTIMIGTTINDPNPTNNEFILNQQLAAAYANIANRQMIHNATLEALNMDRLPEYIARALPNTQLIEIAVTDTDPMRAQAVANELATQMVLLSPTGAQPEEQGRQEFINERLNILEVQINETEDEIKNLQEDLGNMISATQIDETQDQISSLQSKLITLQDNYGTLLSNTRQGAINSLTQIERAELPTRPIGPNFGLTMLLAAALGFILAVSEAYLLEYLNDTLKSSDDISRLFSAPIIGNIFEQKALSKGSHLYEIADLHHPSAEAFRILRTNIEIAEANQPLKTILVTSSGPGDGKTSVAANLALFLTQRNKRVALIDADLRKPNIHKYFNLTNELGLVDLFSRQATLDDVLKVSEDRKLAVLTAGNASSNPAELLSSTQMDQLLSKLKETADFVIIDSPPFIIADAIALSSKVDGVLLVVRPGHTPKPLAQSTMEQIKLVGVRLVGVVLNRIPLHGEDYYAGKKYLYTQYSNIYKVREDIKSNHKSNHKGNNRSKVDEQNPVRDKI
jgi:polysaccharide biosynthesis transport protein